jgi:DNA-binding NtrC family response regulator
MRSRILFISGRHEDARRLSQMLLASPLFLDHVETLLQARAKLQQEDYQVVLTEAALPDGNWLDALPASGLKRSTWAYTICWRSPSTSRRCAAF